MKEGPDISRVAALIGDPARANMLTALMAGRALTAGELAREASIQVQTASSHLAKLLEGGLVKRRKSGRHHFYTLAHEDVAKALEVLMGLAAGQGHLRMRTGPKDAAMRQARVCYNHLAGEKGVRMYRAMLASNILRKTEQGLDLTEDGEAWVAQLGIDLTALPKSKAPMCRECLDWSARESHLAGQLGRALLSHFIEQGWARRQDDSRVVQFSPKGETAFADLFGAPLSVD